MRSRAISTAAAKSIATMKALGATGARVFAIYLTQVLMLALIGGVIGPGARRSAAVRRRLERSAPIIPLPLEPALHPGELALALLYGLLTALAFALWPLGRAHDVPVAALFRDARRAAAALAAPALRRVSGRRVLALLAVLAVALAYDRRIAAHLRRRRRRRVRAAAAGRRRC